MKLINLKKLFNVGVKPPPPQMKFTEHREPIILGIWTCRVNKLWQSKQVLRHNITDYTTEHAALLQEAH